MPVMDFGEALNLALKEEMRRDRRVYCIGPFGDMHAVSLADGKLLWKAHLLNDWDARRPNWGVATSPLLYRDLARLRTTADGVRIPERDPDDLLWRGAHLATWQAFCDEVGLARLRSRPHRWQDG